MRDSEGAETGSACGLEASRVGSLPSVYLLPDFIDEAAEARLLSQIHSRGRWKQLSGRRLQEYGGTVHHKHGLLQSPTPDWISNLMKRWISILFHITRHIFDLPRDVHNAHRSSTCCRVASETGLWTGVLPNHVLLNAYPPGGGIMVRQATSILLALLAEPCLLSRLLAGSRGKAPGINNGTDSVNLSCSSLIKMAHCMIHVSASCPSAAMPQCTSGARNLLIIVMSTNSTSSSSSNQVSFVIPAREGPSLVAKVNVQRAVLTLLRPICLMHGCTAVAQQSPNTKLVMESAGNSQLAALQKPLSQQHLSNPPFLCCLCRAVCWCSVTRPMRSACMVLMRWALMPMQSLRLQQALHMHWTCAMRAVGVAEGLANTASDASGLTLAWALFPAASSTAGKSTRYRGAYICGWLHPLCENHPLSICHISLGKQHSPHAKHCNLKILQAPLSTSMLSVPFQ